MGKQKKATGEGQVESPVSVQPPVAPPKAEARVWNESFEDPTHHQFLRMSAEAMQEAMNIAAKQGDVEKMLAAAASWGTLAVTMKDLQKSKYATGFTGGSINE